MELRQWWSEGGKDSSTQGLTGGSGGGMGGREVPFGERGVLDDIKSRQLGYGEKPDYIGVAATLNFVRSEKIVVRGLRLRGLPEEGRAEHRWDLDVREVQQHVRRVPAALHRVVHLHRRQRPGLGVGLQRIGLGVVRESGRGPASRSTRRRSTARTASLNRT